MRSKIRFRQTILKVLTAFTLALPGAGCASGNGAANQEETKSQEIICASLSSMLSEQQSMETAVFSPYSLIEVLLMVDALSGEELHADFEKQFGWDASMLPEMSAAFSSPSIQGLSSAIQVDLSKGDPWNLSWIEQAAKKQSASVETGKESPYPSLQITNLAKADFQWKEAFDKQDNAEGLFFRKPDESSTLTYMNKVMEAAIQQEEEYVRAEIEMNDGITLQIALPDAGIDLSAVSSRICQDLADKKMPSEKEQVQVSLPKMNIENFHDTDQMFAWLNKQSIDADRPGLFPDLLETKEESEQMHLTRLEQKIQFKMDEEGVKARAETIASIDGAAMEEDLRELNCCRPFLFRIVSKDGLVLFLGQFYG